jgi:hypothetical protein
VSSNVDVPQVASPFANYIVTVSNALFTAVNGVYVFCDALDVGGCRFVRRGQYKGCATEFHITQWFNEKIPGYVWGISRLITEEDAHFDHYRTVGSSEQYMPLNGAVWRCTHPNCYKCPSPTVIVSTIGKADRTIHSIHR